jgi:hypothetical protein
MNWDEVKQKIDDAITEQLGAGFNAQDVEIDWIDIHYYSEISVVLFDSNGVKTLRVT